MTRRIEVRHGPGFGGTAKRGRLGEQAIAFHYDGVMMPARHPWDVEVPGKVCGVAGRPARVEVKCDSYDPRETLHAFVERWVVSPKGVRRAGGPFRAAEDGVDAYAYYYPKTGLVLWMWGLPDLCVRLDAAVAGSPDWRKLRIGNPDGRRALGRLVPRVALAELAYPNYKEDYV